MTLNGLADRREVEGPGCPSSTRDAGFSDEGMPCTLTEASGDQCIVWNVEAAPESGFSSADVQIFQPNTDMNTRVLKNEATDITTFVRSIDPGGRTRTFSVFSLNQASGTGNAVSCGYQSPVHEASDHKQGSTIPFKFRLRTLRPIVKTVPS